MTPDRDTRERRGPCRPRDDRVPPPVRGGDRMSAVAVAVPEGYTIRRFDFPAGPRYNVSITASGKVVSHSHKSPTSAVRSARSHARAEAR